MSSKRRNKSHARLCICTLCKADHDAGKRMSDALNMYRANMPWEWVRDKWMAFRLSDGASDGVLYDSKREAVAHQLHEFQCCYISFRNLMGGATPLGCMTFLNFTRDAYDAGFRLPDPDDVHGGRDVIPTAAQIDAVTGTIRPVLQGLN